MKHKDRYDNTYILDFSLRIHSVMPSFDHNAFSNNLIGCLDDKELFTRLDIIVDAMEKSMTDDYSKNIQAFYNLLGPELAQSEGMFKFGWWLWPISKYVERHGNEDLHLSLSFLKELTKRFTGEYAIRPLLKEHPKEVMAELITWTTDESVHVRRLASEGVRIHLPWSQKLLVALAGFGSCVKIVYKQSHHTTFTRTANTAKATIKYIHCNSEKIVKMGKQPNDTPRYKYNNYKKTFQTK